MFFSPPTEVFPVVIITEEHTRSAAFTFPRELTEKFMEAIIAEVPEAQFYTVEPERMDQN